MKRVAPASQQTTKLYNDICEVLSNLGTEVGSMFGMPALKRNGKAFAGLFGDAMVFKLEADAHEAALALAGSELFDPSGMKRPMKAWVVISPQHRKRWLAFARQSFESIALNKAIPSGASPARSKRTRSSVKK